MPSRASFVCRSLSLLLLACLCSTGCLSTPVKRGISPAALQGQTRVACVGDSITAGAGLADPASSAYPAVLAQLLGPAYLVRNFGVSGSTMLKDGDLPYASTPEFQEAREFLPDVVVIALGTNDSKPRNWRFRNTLERDTYAMVRAFLTLPSRPVVYLCTPPPVFQDRWGINNTVVSHTIAPFYRQLSAREGWPLIDLNRALRSSASRFPDGVHPNALAAAQIAGAVEAAFRGL